MNMIYHFWAFYFDKIDSWLLKPDLQVYNAIFVITIAYI